MSHDDFLKQVTSKLDGLAQQHKAKPVVMNHVLDEIQATKHSRFAFLKISGFALAAAIAGVVVLPNLSTSEDNHTQVAAVPKLSPQMVEDLEMLMVLGEDKVPHGS